MFDRGGRRLITTSETGSFADDHVPLLRRPTSQGGLRFGASGKTTGQVAADEHFRPVPRLTAEMGRESRDTPESMQRNSKSFRPAFERLESRGMLTLNGEGITLTRQGLLQVDSLLPEFYAAQSRKARYP